MPSIITNKQNLPDTLVKACRVDSHKVAGDFSVTQLIDSPRIRILKKQNTYEEDVSDMLFALMGTALHHILERANIDSMRERAFHLVVDTIKQKAKNVMEKEPDKATQLEKAANYIFSLIPVFFPEIADRYLFEHTLRFDVLGKTIYGTFDLFDKIDKVLWDYKYCSVYVFMYPESQKKWKAQTNIYAHGLRKEGYEVKKIRILAFFRDWHTSGMMQSRDYPREMTREIHVDVVPDVDIERYLDVRVEKHIAAETAEFLPECTGAERWAKADTWALKTKGAKRAIVVYDVHQMAKDYLAEHQHVKSLYIEFRPGESMRCDKYCPVAKFCDQRQREIDYKIRMSRQTE